MIKEKVIYDRKLNETMRIRLVKWNGWSGHYIETKEDDDEWAMLVDNEGDGGCGFKPERMFNTPKEWFEAIIKVVKTW